MSAEIAHMGLTPKVGETFRDRDGTKFRVVEIHQVDDDVYDALLNVNGDYNDWFRLDSEMLTNYALTRRPAE